MMTKEQIEARIRHCEKNGAVQLGSEEALAVFHLALKGLAVEWRPMSEAPKDWSGCLLYDPEIDGEPFVGRYYCDEERWREDAARGLGVESTHFIPLSALGEPKP